MPLKPHPTDPDKLVFVRHKFAIPYFESGEMSLEEIRRWCLQAGWTGIYTQWREPNGEPDWEMVRESLTVPVTLEQIESFVAVVAGHVRERCARVAEAGAQTHQTPNEIAESIRAIGVNAVRKDAIRARGDA